ncbi:MAG: metallophosphoesterase [Planctomycetia bacterium]|nr:metallophosphoesterase [Planctomycetia bacterium]
MNAFLIRICTAMVVVLCFIQLGRTNEIPKDETLFVFVSDPHIHLSPTEGGGGLRFDTVSDFQKCVSDVVAMNPRPQAVFILGDLQHKGISDEPYEKFRELLRPWDAAGVEYCLLLGNHDQPGRFFRVFPEWREKTACPDALIYAYESPQVDFLLFETTDYSNGWYGLIPPTHELWYESQMKDRNKPVFLCGHHDWALMRTKPRLDNPAIQGWICGHRHDFVTTNFDDIRELRVPASGHSHVGYNGYLIMRVTNDAYVFTLKTYDPQNPHNGKIISLPKRELPKPVAE